MTQFEKDFEDCLKVCNTFSREEVIDLYNIGQTNKEEAVKRYNNLTKKQQAQWCHLYVAYALLLRESGELKD